MSSLPIPSSFNSNERKDELIDYLNATKFTTSENLISLVLILVTLFFHLVFTITLHI